MNTVRFHSLMTFFSLTLLVGCSNMPSAKDINGISEKLKNVISKPGRSHQDPRSAPTIDEPLKKICDTVRANPVTGIESYFKKRLTVRGLIRRISQNYINDYSISLRSPEGIPVFLEITDRNVIRELQVKMNIEATGSVSTVGNRATTSDYKGCSILLSNVEIKTVK